MSNHRFSLFARWIYWILDKPRLSYPNFDQWFFSRFVPGLLSGSRSVIVCKTGDIIIGVALLKDDQIEKKICRLEVKEEFRGIGIGKLLFEKSFEILNSDHPVISMPEDRMHLFTPLLKYYGFELGSVYPGYYRRNSTEYVYHGLLNSGN